MGYYEIYEGDDYLVVIRHYEIETTDEKGKNIKKWEKYAIIGKIVDTAYPHEGDD